MTHALHPEASTGPDDPADSAGSAALRIAIVGPSHPRQGTVAAHTTMLAHHLADAGHEVTLVSWPHPARMLDADVATSEGAAQVPPFPRTIRALGWARPDTWVRAGRRLRGADAVLVVHGSPTLVPAHLALLRAAGALSGGTGARPQSVVVCYAGLPAAAQTRDARLMSLLIGRVDSVLVHSLDQASRARDLGARRVSVAELPSVPLGGEPVARGPQPLSTGSSRSNPSTASTASTRLLTLGPVHESREIDVLLRAMRSVPGVTLTIAGEVADRDVRARLAADPALAGRVEIRDGSVPAEALAALLADHDVLAASVGSATASQNVTLGHTHGLPVLAPDIAPFSSLVVDGVDGILVPPGDEPALTAALRRLGDPEVRRRLADGVQTPDLSGPWAHYLGTVEALSVDEGVLLGHPSQPYAGPDRPLARSRGVVATDAGRAVGHVVGGVVAQAAQRVRRTASRSVASRRPLVSLGLDDLPEWVLATDVLGAPDEADDARRLSRILGLPRSFDAVSAWAALGTLASILRVRDDGRRSAVIVDEGGPRSLLSRWARAVGFAPVEIDFTGTHPSVAALDVDTGSLDVIVRIHPRGCDGDDVDHVLEQASWALRSGGLLVITVPIGPRAADGAIGPADVRGILARAHDLGFVLIGDLDGDVTARMREASSRARADDAAYGLVRLTLRRR